MQVKLISYTLATMGGEQTYDNPEEILVHIARVSSSRDDKTASPEKLIRYLIKNRHWSPFEMVSACVEIQTSRAIAQQILRHRSFSYQEFSQRYAEAIEIEECQLRKQAVKNRQSSEEEIDDKMMYMILHETHNRAQEAYRLLLGQGVAKECARMVLPLATRTTLYMHGTLRSWIHYLQVRDDEHAQLEHQEIARGIKDMLGEIFPHTWTALGW